MKNRISNIMMVMILLSGLSSCMNESFKSNSYGDLIINLESDFSEEVLTKADDDSGVEEPEYVFAIDIYDSKGSLVRTIDDHRMITEENPISLYVGSYSVTARSGENLNAAFESPYYEGRTEQNIKVVPHRAAEAQITCTLANTMFSVGFPEDFATHFSEYEVTVSNGQGEELVFSSNPDPEKRNEAGLDAKGYFAVTGILEWSVYLKNNEGGEYTATEKFTDVKARQHYHLNFAMGEPDEVDGAFVIRVSLQNNWDDAVHELILDFCKKDMPEVRTNDAFSVNSGELYSVPVGNDTPKKFILSAPAGIKSVHLSHNNETFSTIGLPKRIEFVDASEELLSALKGIGVVSSGDGSENILPNSTYAQIDVTDYIANLPVAEYGLDVAVIDNRGRYDLFKFVLEVISDVDAEAVAARTGWAVFAQLEGRFYKLDKKDEVTFQYRKASETEWIEIPVSEIDVNTATLRYTTLLTGLEPSTEYVFRAVSSEDKDTKVMSFTTANYATIHNLSFDYWYQDGKAWMPNESSGNYVWDTANPGTSGLGYVPTTPEETVVVSGKAARLETQLANVMGIEKLAAGNIYTGKFGKVAGVGAELTWGIPFTARPLALRGHWKYAPKTINWAESPYSEMKGQTDFCQVQMFLTDWSEPFLISTSKKQFVDFNSSSIIARGELHTNETHDGYVEFTIPLVYRNHRIPKYAVISGAASMYGDYFTGGVGSVLLLDEFELVYDPSELTEEEYEAVFSVLGSPFKQ